MVWTRSLAAARTALAEPPPPDLVVLDAVLPDGDSLGFCRALKAAQPSLPIAVFSTLWNHAGIDEEALGTCVDLLVARPLDLDALKAGVNRLLHQPSPLPGTSR